MKTIMNRLAKKRTERVNPLLFNRNSCKKIHEYIVDVYRAMESLPYITLLDYELVTDESKIDVKINRRHIKNKTILKDKSITKVRSINRTAKEMLVAHFKIEFQGEYRYITKRLIIPAYVDNYHLLIDGNSVLPINQLVDISTYNQKNSIKEKTMLTPIDIYREVYKKKQFINTEGTEFKVKAFVLNLFTKKVNPLYYYLAIMGVTKVINYFSLKGIVDVTDKVYDESINYYFRINKKLYVEVGKEYFNESEYVRMMTFLLFEIFVPRANIKDIDDKQYWLIKLGTLFTSNTKNQEEKGRNVLISMDRVLDDTTHNTLQLADRHLVSTHSLIRYILQNFAELRHKDNHNMEHKRLRCNEAIAYCFNQNMAVRINSVLNKKKLVIEGIEKIFNFNEDELVQLLQSGKGQASDLLRYNLDLNDFTALNALRYTKTGPQGITGKHAKNEHRDIYPSHIGRLDVNGISHGPNTGLTGFIVPFCEMDEKGFFSKESKEPDGFKTMMTELRNKFDAKRKEKMIDIEKLKDIDYQERLRLINMESLKDDETGLYVVPKRKKIFRNLDDGTIVIPSRFTPDKVNYRDEKGRIKDQDDYFIVGKRDIGYDANGIYNMKARDKALLGDDGIYRIPKRKITLRRDEEGYTSIPKRLSNKVGDYI